MAEFGTGKTIFILAIVVGCFAILWPKIFYPMLMSSLPGAVNQPISTVDPEAKCCDVITETDVTAIKVITEMCGNILHNDDQLHIGHLPKKYIEKCRDEVMNTCGLDITAIIKDNAGLTKNYKHILDEMRSFNNSACLKQNFGLQLMSIGATRTIKFFKEYSGNHMRQERPAHLHPDMLHPALREKGRAIPQHKSAKPLSVGAVTGLDSDLPRPGPMHMRPTMGGGGHVQAPKGGGTMGIIMPLYTIGIVIFFVYTIMKMIFKKTEDRSKYADYNLDPEFRKMMYGSPIMEEDSYNSGSSDGDNFRAEINGYRASSDRPPTKLVVTAISGLLAEVDQQLLASEVQLKHDKEEKMKNEIKEEIYNEETIIYEDKNEKIIETKVEEIIKETEIEIESDENLNEEVEIPQAVDDDIKKDEVEEEEEEKLNGERTASPIQQILEEGGKVTVVGMETTAQCEGGHKWKSAGETPPRSNTPTIPLYAIEQYVPPPPPPPPLPPSQQRWTRPPTPPTPPRSITPLSPHISNAAHTYFLETPHAVLQGGHHGILVSDSECEAVPLQSDGEITEDEDSAPPVILSGKMTLSVISLPSESSSSPATTDPSTPQKLMQVTEPEEEKIEIEEPAVLQQPEPSPIPSPQQEEVIDIEMESSSKPVVPLINGIQDEITATNYTTASAAAMEEQEEMGERQEETSADISGIDDEHVEAQDIEEPVPELEDLPQDDGLNEHHQTNGTL